MRRLSESIKAAKILASVASTYAAVAARHVTFRCEPVAHLLNFVTQHCNLLIETDAKVVDLGGRHRLMLGVLGRDALHDPQGHRCGDDADEGDSAEHQEHRDHSSLDGDGVQVAAGRRDRGDRPPHRIAEVADVGIRKWTFGFENRLRRAIDEQNDAEEGEDGDPAAHGSAARLLQR